MRANRGRRCRQVSSHSLLLTPLLLGASVLTLPVLHPGYPCGILLTLLLLPCASCFPTPPPPAGMLHHDLALRPSTHEAAAPLDRHPSLLAPLAASCRHAPPRPGAAAKHHEGAAAALDSIPPRFACLPAAYRLLQHDLALLYL